MRLLNVWKTSTNGIGILLMIGQALEKKGIVYWTELWRKVCLDLEILLVFLFFENLLNTRTLWVIVGGTSDNL